MNEPSFEEVADGMALWQEHRPRTVEDWQAVARRFSEGESEAQARVAELEAALRSRELVARDAAQQLRALLADTSDEWYRRERIEAIAAGLARGPE